MRKLANYLLCVILGMTITIFPRIADAVVLFWQAVLLAVAVVCIVALSWFAVVFLHRRSVNASSTAQASQEPPQHTQHGYAVPAVEQAVLQHAYNVAALQLADLSRHKRGSYSIRALSPYIAENRRDYWTHFVSEMERLGFVVKHKRKGYIWQGSYRLFAIGLQWKRWEIAPHPTLPAPVILHVIRGLGTLSTPNTPNTPGTADTVTSYGDAVFIGT